MPLETGDFISDLVETNPPGTDNVSQGDDHVRLIKHVLKTTFPNLSCAVTATCEDLNSAGQSNMPKITVYSTAAAAQTHTFEAGRSWYKVIVTGGGGGGESSFGYGGNAGGTAIKTEAITEADATFTVGAGGVVAGAGEASTFQHGAFPMLTGEGGLGGISDPSHETPIDQQVGINGDLNLYGGQGDYSYGNGRGGRGGASYWGEAGESNTSTPPRGNYGCGGRSSGSDPQVPAYAGVTGAIYIEEY